MSEHLGEHKLFFQDTGFKNRPNAKPLVFCKNKSWSNLNFDQLEEKFGFNLLDSIQTNEFINSFNTFDSMNWSDIEQSIGLEYKPYTGDWFNNSGHKGKVIKKFRVSKKYRCFGYREVNIFYVLRFEIDHKISDKG
ncbi:hypothetical protein [uncultured Gammaproteobacteria bacterium]|nr:hypothetical protein [uncultured Gammaproteobacteria bacterium]